MVFFVIAIIVLIILSLGSAAIGMVRGGQEGSDRMFNSLRFRTALSVFLFIALMFAGYMGWIEPNNILPTQ